MATKVISESYTETLAVAATPGQFALIKTRNGHPEVIVLNPRELESIMAEGEAWLPKAKAFMGIQK